MERRYLLPVYPAVEDLLFAVGDKVANLFDVSLCFFIDGVQAGGGGLRTVAADVDLHISNVEGPVWVIGKGS